MDIGHGCKIQPEDRIGGDEHIDRVTQFTRQNGALNILPSFSNPTLRSVLAFGGVGSALGIGGSSGSSSGGLLTTGQGDRCPGSMERGGVYYPESGFPCNPSEVPTGK